VYVSWRSSLDEFADPETRRGLEVGRALRRLNLPLLLDKIERRDYFGNFIFLSHCRTRIQNFPLPFLFLSFVFHGPYARGRPFLSGITDIRPVAQSPVTSI
jgi:hypothetical protein